jgi:hypothetical protein
MGMLQWAMEHFECSSPVPWATTHPPWSSLWLSHGTLQMFNPYPMGHYALPMDLPAPALHLSHGCVTMDHGTSHLLNLCDSVPWATIHCLWSFPTSVPWPCYIGPWDITNVQPLSHGLLHIAHGPASHLSHGLVTAQNKWRRDVLNGPWDIPSVQPPPHGLVKMDHGAFTHVKVQSHGHALVDHGTSQMSMSCPMGLSQ